MICSLQRTNVRMTGNIKIVLNDSDVFIESIDSSQELTRSKYKSVKYNTDHSYAKNVRKFCSEFSDTSTLYNVIDESQIKQTNILNNQYHTDYDFGCYSNSSQIIKSMFRFFAPIYVEQSKINELPDAFVIYRLDKTISDYSTALKSAKLVKLYDLSEINLSLSQNFEDAFIRVKFDEGFEVHGIDIKSGQYTRKAEGNIEALLANERTIIEFENYVTNIYSRQELINNNIINLEFCFDDEILSDMTEYVGFYVNYENITKSSIDQINTTSLKLLKREYDTVQYLGNALQTYDKQVSTLTAINYGALREPQANINVNYNPKVGEKIELVYTNKVILSITITSSLLGNTASQTTDKLIQRIAADLLNVNDVSLTVFKSSNTSFTIRANSKTIQLESITVNLPKTLSINDILFSIDGKYNSFYGSDKTTITTSSLVPYTSANKLKLTAYVNGVLISTIHDIIKITKYGEVYLYRISNVPSYLSTCQTNIQCIKTYTEQPILCHVIEHHELDFDYTKRYYYDITDFDKDLYQSYVMSVVNDPAYMGNLPSDATEQDILNYKALVSSQVNSYFNNIISTKEYLANDINVVTFESTTTDNEYNRLHELTVQFLSNVNRLSTFINKFRMHDALDAYNNMYRLNIALPFRYDNFSPSIDVYDRDLQHNTHQLPVIIEGRQPYLTCNEQTIKKIMSHSNAPIELSEFSNVNTDAYDKLLHTTEVDTYGSWSTLKFDNDFDTCRTFFRGLLFECPDTTLDNYRFTIVLKTKYPTKNDEIEYRLIRNNTFKTITLTISFYIPDPILTRQERSIDYYYLDRSLLYYSNEIYSTQPDINDFGYVDISVSLFNTARGSQYANTVIANDVWYITDPDNNANTLLYVKRGDAVRFSTNFNDILTIGSTLVIRYGNTELGTSDPMYGMQIQFIDVRAVYNDYFWCSDIIIDYVDVADSNNTPTDPTDDTVIQPITISILNIINTNPNRINTDNIFYVAKYLANNSMKYQKIVKSRANVARYKLLSTSQIAKHLNNVSIPTYTEYIDTSSTTDIFTDIRVIDSTKSTSVISLTNTDGNISNVPQQYTIDIKRYDGYYKPIMYLLSKWSNNDTEFNTVLSDTRYLQVITSPKTRMSYLSETYTETHTSRIFNKTYSYYHLNNKVTIPFTSVFSSFRGYTSIVLNSTNTISLRGTVQNSLINIYDLLEDFASGLLKIDQISYSTDDKLKIVQLYTDVTTNTVNQFNEKTYIIRNFIQNVLLKTYTINTVTIDNVRHQFFYDKTVIHITDITISGTAIVTISR